MDNEKLNLLEKFSRRRQETRVVSNSVSQGSELGQELQVLGPYGLGWSGSRVEEIKPIDENWDKIRNSRNGVIEIIDEDDKRCDLEYEFTQNEINLDKLQRIASTGLPSGGSFRATTWKLLLGYLPPSRGLWMEALSKNRFKYAKLKEEFLPSPVSSSAESDDGPLSPNNVPNGNHSLNLGEASCTKIAEQIDRDLQRTHPELRFFSEDSSRSKKIKESMRNILLLFAKLNPTTRYVQGMHEVLAPIYYVFSTDADEEHADNAEADSFACFVRLLSDSVDHFCQRLDNSSTGILSTLCRLQKMLKAKDEELWRHLEYKSKVHPQYYAFRWITVLLTQEFPFGTILRIWDSLLSNPSGVQDMLLRICCSMLLCMKSRLLEGDFAANLYLLQHYPEVNIEHLLQLAREIDPDASKFRLSI